MSYSFASSFDAKFHQRVERWPVRTLNAKIQGTLYERTAITHRPALLAKAELDGLRDKDRMTPDLVFRDPYRLDFLGLPSAFSERDLESALLRELESFLPELGTEIRKGHSVQSEEANPLTVVIAL